MYELKEKQLISDYINKKKKENMLNGMQLA